MIQLNTNDHFTTYPDVVTVKQLQQMLGIGRNTAYALITQDKIRFIRIGNQIKIAKQSVIDFINGGGNGE